MKYMYTSNCTTRVVIRDLKIDSRDTMIALGLMYSGTYNKPEIPGQTVCYKQEFVIRAIFHEVLYYMVEVIALFYQEICYRRVCYKSVPLLQVHFL